jgi:hypothetical protein
MSATDQGSIFVRIIELPPVKMARSGSGDLEAFNQWWSADFNQRNNQLSPQDFMWFNPQLGNLEWLYVLPEGLSGTAGYEVFDFPGGLYAVAACKDQDAEIEKTSIQIRKWVEGSGIFEKAPESSGRFEMGHVITPRNAKQTLGYHQMDLFIPIVTKTSVKK